MSSLTLLGSEVARITKAVMKTTERIAMNHNLKVLVPAFLATFLVGEFVGQSHMHNKMKVKLLGYSSKFGPEFVEHMTKWLTDPNDTRNMDEVTRDWYYLKEFNKIVQK